MNNLITCPLSFVCEVDQHHLLQPEGGIHVFHETSGSAQLAFEVIEELYRSDVFVTEHDTSDGGDQNTQKLLRLFEIPLVPCVVFIFKSKKGYRVLRLNHYFGSIDTGSVDNLVSLYERANVAPQGVGFTN